MAVTAWGQLYIQTAMPAEDPVQVGSLWADTSGTPAVKVCTAISPYTFASVGGGGAPSAHATTHQDGGSDEINVTGLSGLLADSQTPLAHATTHKSAGSDPIRIDELKVGTDVTTLNATATEHGLLKKLSALTNEFMRGDGTWNPVAGEDLTTSDSTTVNASTTKHGFALKAVAPASGVRNIIAIDNGETIYKNTALVDSTNPAALGTVAPGTSLIAARRDHVHANPALDTLAAPTDITTLDASTSAHGLVVKAVAPAANVLNVVGIANGETAYTNKTLFDGTNPAALGTAAPGTSLSAAHRDHVHSATIASIIGTGTTTLQGLVDISGASAGQIKFPATQNASTDAHTLDDYEEGTWTPTDGSGASLALVSPDAHSGSPFGGYIKIGQMVYIAYGVEYPVTANGSQAKIDSLPFTTENNTPAVYWGQTLAFTSSNGPMTSLNANVTWFSFYSYPPTPAAQTNVQMSTKYVYGNFQFRCTA